MYWILSLMPVTGGIVLFLDSTFFRRWITKRLNRRKPPEPLVYPISLAGALAQARIPKPSSLIVDLLVMRVSLFPPGDAYCAAEGFVLRIPVSGRDIEVRYERRKRQTRDGFEITKSVAVASPGSPRYLSVTLSDTDSERLCETLESLRSRSLDKARLDAEAASENAALDMLDLLTRPTETPSTD